jgi:hypothetical protein
VRLAVPLPDGRFVLTFIHFRFVMSTESYGARLAPTFVNYFNSQNALIESGELDGLPLVVTALSISKYVILFQSSSSPDEQCQR